MGAPLGIFAKLAGAVEYTDCFTAGSKTPPTIILVITLSNLMGGGRPVIKELLGMRSTFSFTSFPDPL